MAVGKEKLRKMLLYQKYITFCLERELGVAPVPEERMLKWFSYEHLKDPLKRVSVEFHDLAVWLCQEVESGPERTACLRKLLEAKDAAVRAKINPGG